MQYWKDFVNNKLYHFFHFYYSRKIIKYFNRVMRKFYKQFPIHNVNNLYKNISYNMRKNTVKKLIQNKN